MSEKSKPKSISRRSFLQGMGAGVVGTPLIISNLKAAKSGIVTETDAALEKLSLTVNGKKVSVRVEARATLADLIRDHLKLTGTKVACNQGECGNCTVLLDGAAVYACHTLALDAAGKEVITVEGLLSGEELHPVQEAFWQNDGFQCGFCTPGQVMAAYALLLKTPKPNRQQVLQGMSGNICRCAAYPKILDSVMAASKTSTS